MPEDLEANEGEVSDAMSENEYDDTDPHLGDGDDDKMTASDMKNEDGTTEVKKKYDAKDPLRPRRKKARRACYACQRAHLTCGDERPCQRCVKRGLSETCQDGVRKKAKYLHDAPPEALRPVLGPNYNPNATPSRPNGHTHPSGNGSDASAVGGFFPQTSPTSAYPVFSTTQTPGATIPESLPFSTHQSPVSPSFQTSGNGQMGGLTVPQVSREMSSFNSPNFFDPNNPGLYNFNLEGLNFGSQYAAMEFGILGQMSSGAGENASRDASLSQQGAGSVYGSSGVYGNGANQQLYDGGAMGDFVGLDPPSNGLYSHGNLQHGLPHAYAIAAAPASLQSPSTETDSPQPTHFGFEGSPTAVNYATPATSGSQSIAAPRPKAKPVALNFPPSILGKRQRDASSIYEQVKEPYMYVKGFHKLIALLQARFSANKTLRIAKSLSSIRPSFISCTRTLNREDLIFMEKSFQRSLFEFEAFMLRISSPAIVCRRTGEVVMANKEFTALTGWTKNVLLGKDANLNVNLGSSGSASVENSGRAGLTTPRLKTLNAEAVEDEDGKPQPLFLAELMDDDSVMEFYEDFAHLAFGDSRSSVTRKCQLLKYRTRDMLDGSTSGSVVDEGQQAQSKDLRSSILSNRVARIDGEHGISRIEKDGKLECTYCWHIRRDTFDIPMMVVMNFLPCYYPNQEPHQLAV